MAKLELSESRRKEILKAQRRRADQPGGFAPECDSLVAACEEVADALDSGMDADVSGRSAI
jgi:hypothetical protein